MTDVRVFDAGGYRYIPAVFQYSGGVAAQPGFELERARFSRPLPLAEGFAAIEAHLRRLGRPLTAFCGCELRSPAPFSEEGFRELNQSYAKTLISWNIARGDDNPVARSNVCPLIDPPAEVSFHAFSYSVPAGGSSAPRRAAPSFVVSGGAECPEGKSNYRDHIIARGDTSASGLRDKVHYVLAAMEARLDALGAAWSDATAAHVYTIHDIGKLMGADIMPRGPHGCGVTWQWCRPPVVDLEFEMDVRGPARELII